MQKTWEELLDNYKLILIGFVCGCFVVIIYYALTNGVKFSNNVEYKDIFTLLINILFVFFISNSISKNYDSQRKKKDLLIDEVKFIHSICIEQFQAIKLNNYDPILYLTHITKVRDELETIKQILNLSDMKIDFNVIFASISQLVRQVDRTINSPHQSFPLSEFDKSMIDHYVRGIRKQLFQVIYLINNS